MTPTPEQLAWYESGLMAGIERGRRQADDDAAAIWRAVRERSIPAALAGIDRPFDYERVRAARALIKHEGVAA